MTQRQWILIGLGLLICVLVLLLILKNRKDRKELFPPSSIDPVEEQKTAQYLDENKS